MRLALSLALRARGNTHPNPIVGAVVVAGDKILSRGYHHRAGLPHAEIDALAKISNHAPGATMYVTLEPCCHVGRTGPCTLPIIAAGVRRVVVGSRDPNPLVNGRGITALRRAGLTVDVGCLEEQCIAANAAFFTWVALDRPRVTLKAAATLDGFIAARASSTAAGHKGIHWITGPLARRAVHEMRAAADAVLVGVGTVIADDPRLTVRLPRAKGTSPRAPLRVVLDGNLRTPVSARLFTTAARAPLIIGSDPSDAAAIPRRASARRHKALQRAGAEILLLPGDRQGHVPLVPLLAALAKRGVQSLFVEGGSQIHGAFIAAGLVDEVAIFFAPQLAGGGLPIATGPVPQTLAALTLGPLQVRRLGSDILLRAQVVPPTRGQAVSLKARKHVHGHRRSDR